MITRPLVGVLAVQGAFVEHESALAAVGAETRQVRTPADLDGIDGLVIPGGESTTLGLVANASGLLGPLRQAIRDGLPTFGTCAGMIMLANATTGGDQTLLGGMDTVVRRNAFGRQVASFEAPVSLPSVGAESVPGVFIRAPWIERCGPGVQVLATYDSHIVAAREDNMLVVAFHPELTDDTRIHGLFVDMIRNSMRDNRSQTTGGSARVGAQ